MSTTPGAPAVDRVRARVEAVAARSGTTAAPEAWAPNAGPQELFLSLSCFEALYGGAAGGGKSDALLAAAARPVVERSGYGRGYTALLLRRTFPELELSLLRRSHELYPRLGGRWNEQKKHWRFSNGEHVVFGHVEHEKEVTRYQGAAFQFIGLDELTTFTEYQYLYLFSRCRSAQGVPCRIRGATNPGGIGHTWVRARWLAWVSRSAPTPALPGKVRYFRRVNDQDLWVPKGTPGALGRTFVPALLSDNPALEQGDPEYRARLQSLPRLERLRLEGGDWDARPAKKDYWDRDRIRVMHARPPRDEIVGLARGWDFGATEKGDPSVGALGAWTKSGLFVVMHLVHFQGAPDRVDAEFSRFGEADREYDPRTLQVIPQDPGAAGKFAVADFQRKNTQLAIRARRPDRDKPTRFRPLSSRALSGQVAVVDDGSWDVAAMHDELEDFPLGPRDDRADALSDAYAGATGNVSAEFTEELASAAATASPTRAAERDAHASFMTLPDDDDYPDDR